MKTRAEVLQWLKDNGFYEKVKRRLPVTIEKFPTSDADLHEFFISAFDWKHSSEGEDYWRGVNKKYLEWYGTVKSEKSEFNTRIKWTK